jgi:tetratricopeptide (TPR) repeat protein
MQWDPHIDARGIDCLEFEAMTPIYEQALCGDPDDIGTISWLAHAYTRIGRVSDGLLLDQRLIGLLPDDPTARYNLGCSFAMLGRVEEALETLERAIELGYRDGDLMREDEDLASLRTEPRFQRLLDHL